MNHINSAGNSRWQYLYYFPGDMDRYLINTVGIKTFTDPEFENIGRIANDIRVQIAGHGEGVVHR
jgi:hypothetical protein